MKRVKVVYPEKTVTAPAASPMPEIDTSRFEAKTWEEVAADFEAEMAALRATKNMKPWEPWTEKNRD